MQEVLVRLFLYAILSKLSFLSANAQAMMDAVSKIATMGVERCRFAGVIVGSQNRSPRRPEATVPYGDEAGLASLNESQRAAVIASRHPLSLIWGPPGAILSHLGLVKLM